MKAKESKDGFFRAAKHEVIDRAFEIMLAALGKSYSAGNYEEVKETLETMVKIVDDKIDHQETAPSANRADANRAKIQKMLEENDWNIAKVARELNVTRRTLYMRLAAFGITRKKVPRLAKPLK